MLRNLLEHDFFSTLRADCHAAVFEFVGTGFFLFLGLGGIQAASVQNLSGSRLASQIQHTLYIATCMGFSLLVSAWLFFRVTGGAFNPNVSLALLLVGKIRPLRFILYCIAQMVGAVAASAILLGLTSRELSVNTYLQEGTNEAKGVFIEMFITGALVFSVLMLAAEKHQATPFAPIGIGLTLFVTHLFAVYYTGAAVNTARAFGPAVVSGFPFPHHWVYWVGPFLGSLIGAGFYSILKRACYWTLNPNQSATNISSLEQPAVAAIAPGIDQLTMKSQIGTESVTASARQSMSTIVNPNEGFGGAPKVKGNDEAV